MWGYQGRHLYPLSETIVPRRTAAPGLEIRLWSFAPCSMFFWRHRKRRSLPSTGEEECTIPAFGLSEYYAI